MTNNLKQYVKQMGKIVLRDNGSWQYVYHVSLGHPSQSRGAVFLQNVHLFLFNLVSVSDLVPLHISNLRGEKDY